MSVLTRKRPTVGPASASKTTSVSKFFERGLPLPVRVAVTLVVPAVLILWSGMWSPPNLHLMTEIAMWSMVAVCTNIVVGYTGQMNLANSAFMAIGAYVAVRATGFWHWPGWLTIVVAVSIAIVVAALLSLVIFRASGMTFALITTGISLTASAIMINWSQFTGGSGGLSTGGPLTEGGLPRPLDLGFVSISTESQYFALFVIVLSLMTLGISIVLRRKTGEMWKAIREDQVLAASIGVNVRNGKRTAFIVASALGSFVGVLYGTWTSFINPDAFSFQNASFNPLAMVMIGSAGTIVGPMVGAALMVSIPDIFRETQTFSVLIFGLILLAVIMVAPKGIVGVLKSLASRVETLIKARRARKSNTDEEKR